MSPEKQKRAERLENIAHYMTFIVVLLKGVDKIDQPGKMGIGTLFIFFAIVILLGTVFHHKAQKMLKHFKAYILVIEAIVIAIVGYLYMVDGKQYLQYVCFGTSIIFIVALVIYIRNIKPAVGQHH